MQGRFIGDKCPVLLSNQCLFFLYFWRIISQGTNSMSFFSSLNTKYFTPILSSFVSFLRKSWISFLSFCLYVLSCSVISVSPWTVACQASLSMGFYRQEYSSGLPLPPPGDLHKPGIEPPISCVSQLGRQILNHCPLETPN